MLRLERVTFTALRHYLGLHTELAYQSSSSSGTRKGKGKSSPGHQRSNSNYLDLNINLMTQSTHSNQSQSGQVQSAEAANPRPDPPSDNSQNVASTTTNPPPAAAQPDHHHRRKSSSAATYEFDKDDAQLYKTLAIEGFARELGLSREEDKALLAQHVIVKECTPGLTLVTEGEVEEVSLFYVISGSLVVQQTVSCSEVLAQRAVVLLRMRPYRWSFFFFF